MKKIIIIGSGGHAGVILDLIEQLCGFSVYGFLDSFRPLHSVVLGHSVVGDESDFVTVSEQVDGGIVAIGDNQKREEIAAKLKKMVPGFPFVSLVHPSAAVSSSAVLGEGTVVMAGAVINPGTAIGKHCIVNTSASIDHDCRIGHYASIAPGAVLGGNVTVGEGTAISLGARVIHSVNIGDQTVIGAGSTVLQHIGSYKVAYGTPAKIIRSRKKGDRYL